jgi:hypothetical protein
MIYAKMSDLATIGAAPVLRWRAHHGGARTTAAGLRFRLTNIAITASTYCNRHGVVVVLREFTRLV